MEYELLWVSIGLLALLVLLLGLLSLSLKNIPERPLDSETEAYRFPLLPDPKWAELSFGRIHYVEAGNGPQTLLLIHGLGASVFCWRFLLPHFSSRFRVIALDLPGFGLSDKNIDLDYGLDAQTERVAQFLDHLNIKKVDIVGSSMGGLIGIWLAYKDPWRVGRMVGLSPALSPSLLPLDPTSLGVFSDWSSKHLINEVWLKRLMKRIVASPLELTKEHIEAYLKPYLLNPAAIRIFLKAGKTIRDRRIPKSLNKFKTPLLLLHGERDQIIPTRVSKAALKYIAHADLKILPEAGHHLQEDNPQWVAEKVFEFLTLPQSRNPS